MSKIALFEATGAIGQSVAAALRAAGQPYRVVGRSRTALQSQFGADPLAEIVIEPLVLTLGKKDLPLSS